MKNMEFKRKLPVPKEIKEQYPLTPNLARIKNERDAMIADVFTGKSDKNIVGTASLYRKKRLISRATLKTKESDSPEHKLIYWEFN